MHVEVQGYFDRNFPRRMFQYYYRILDRYLEEGYEVVSLGVLIDRKRDYRPSSWKYERWGFKVEMEFPVVKLLDYEGRENELLESENPFGLVVYSWLKDGLRAVEEKEREKERVLRRFLVGLRRRWKERSWSEERLRRLLKFLDGLIELPEKLDKKLFERLNKEVEEVSRYVPPLFREEYES